MGSPAATDRLARLPAAFRWSHAQQVGLSDPKLHQLLRDGAVERIGHGLYLRTDVGPVDIDLVEVALASPDATLCLTTALAHHDLTDQIPGALDVAVPRGRRRPRTRAAVRLAPFRVGDVPSGPRVVCGCRRHPRRLLHRERSIVDVYRLRHLEGLDVAREVRRAWLRRPGSQPAALLESWTWPCPQASRSCAPTSKCCCDAPSICKPNPGSDNRRCAGCQAPTRSTC